MPTFPTYRQQDQMDCGPTCLRMIAKYYGKGIAIDTLRRHSGIGKEGVNLIVEAAEASDFSKKGRYVCLYLLMLFLWLYHFVTTPITNRLVYGILRNRHTALLRNGFCTWRLMSLPLRVFPIQYGSKSYPNHAFCTVYNLFQIVLW